MKDGGEQWIFDLAIYGDAEPRFVRVFSRREYHWGHSPIEGPSANAASLRAGAIARLSSTHVGGPAELGRTRRRLGGVAPAGVDTEVPDRAWGALRQPYSSSEATSARSARRSLTRSCVEIHPAWASRSPRVT